jgi:hypothetical protein
LEESFTELGLTVTQHVGLTMSGGTVVLGDQSRGTGYCRFKTRDEIPVSRDSTIFGMLALWGRLFSSERGFRCQTMSHSQIGTLICAPVQYQFFAPRS